MGIYERRVLPHIIDVVLGGKKMGKLRKRALEGVSGTVLEVGFGSGTNLPYYPTEVEKIMAVDPSLEGRKMATKRLTASSIPVDFIDVIDGRLPLDDASIDNAVSTWTLCTIPDIGLALTDIRRVLKPGGKLYFLEHGISDDPKVAKRQHRFDPIQQKIGGGCHLTRNHFELLTEAGFENVSPSTFAIAGPKVMSFMYAGTATKDS